MAINFTYVPIAAQTLGSSASSVTFSSIPSTYIDLVLVCQTKATGSSVYLALTFNGDTGTNYSRTSLLGDGTTASSTRNSSENYGYIMTIAIPTSDFTTTSTAIQNYSNSTTYKTAITRGNASTAVQAVVNLWRNTAAITSLSIGIGAGSNAYVAGSTFTLYGIAAA